MLNIYHLRHQEIEMHFYSESPNLSGKFLCIFHGLPGNPLDFNAIGYKYFLESGYTIVLPRYLGTWESEGTFSINNATKTVELVAQLLEKGVATCGKSNDYKGKKLNWNPKKVIFSGGSFGGGIALNAAKNQKNIKNIVAIAPVTNSYDQGKNNTFMPELPFTIEQFNYLQKYYSHLWRITPNVWQNIINGKESFDLYQDPTLFNNKKIFLIHAKDDPIVNIKRSLKFKELTGEKTHLLSLSGKQHLTNHILFDEDISKKVLSFFE